MTTITTNRNQLVLSSPAYANPIVINPGVTISQVVASSGYWTIQNGGSIFSQNQVMNLLAGGSVTNQTSALIEGINGVYITGAISTVVNNGTVIATGTSVPHTYSGFGIGLHAGGSVTNAASGTITSGYAAVDVTGATGTVVNYGRIGATGNGNGRAIQLFAGGTVINAQNATISATFNGVVFTGAGNKLFNAGIILSTTRTAIVANNDGYVTNSASGTISGSAGVVIGGTGTVINSGYISGTAGAAVSMSSGVTNLMIVNPGAKFNGSVNGGDAVGGSFASTLELASGSSIGSVSGLGTQFIDFTQVNVDTGASWSFTGSNTLISGIAFTNNGSIALSTKATLAVGSVAGTGIIDLSAGSDTLTINGTISNAIAGFSGGDIIDLTSLKFTTGATASVSGNILTVSSGGSNRTLTVSGISDGTSFAVLKDTGTGSQIVECFAEGTRIAAENGERAIEQLRVGDRIRTMHNGRLSPVVWLGRRPTDCARHTTPEKVWPVRVMANAFGPDTPHSDLLLSPGHAVYINGVLIPIARLINGSTIRQEQIPRVTYWHVELEHHDVILAEGLPAESYLGDRSDFGTVAISLFPDFSISQWGNAARWEALGCAPLITIGPKLDAARQLVNSLAAAVSPTSRFEERRRA
jgi:hypothetical protein